MSKGKTKTGGRSGSDSNSGSRAAASDRKHDERQVQEGKSVKLGSDSGGKRATPRTGSKR